VNELNIDTHALGAPLLMHQAGRVSRHNIFSASAQVIVDLVVTHLGGHRLLEHRERAAKAATFIGPRWSYELDALDLAQQVEGLGEERLVDFEADAVRRARNVEQVLCSPTLCGNSAQGNSLTLRMS